MSAPQEVSLKVSIVRQGEVVETRRRVLVQPSYEVVAQVAAEYARGKYRLQYLDDDSDWITMSTQEEWQDCLALCGTAQPLRLRIELLGAGRAADTSRSNRMHMWPHMAAWWGRNAQHHHNHHHSHGHHHQHQQQAAREGHDGSDCAAWRGGCRARAWYMPSFVHSDANPAAAAAAGDKCANCDFATTGIVPLYCCRACKLGKGHHGRRCMQQVFCAQAEAEDAKAADTTVVEATQVEAEACAAGVHESSDAETQCTRGRRHRHRHGHKAAGAAGVGEKCTNCDFATTGVVESFCCRACQRGRGWHGKCCMQQVFCAQDTQQDVAEAGEAEAADTTVVEAVEATQVEAEACVAEQTESQESSDVEAQCTRGRRHRHGHRAASVAGVGEKCTNCDFATTGVVESFCCRACQRGRGGHGRRCMQQPHAAAAADGTSDKPYAAEIAQLEEMGFTVTPNVERALAAAHGNVSTVLATLLL